MIKESRQDDYNSEKKGYLRGIIFVINLSRGIPALSSFTIIVGMNRKYPDIFNFYGDRDRDLWESWKIYLEVKFR